MAQTDEIIVRFKTEGGDTVEEAFRRVGAGADSVNPGIKRVNHSLDGLRLKSDERLARNLGVVAETFARGGSAADIMAVAVSRLGESFKGALAVGAAGAVGVGLYEAITRIGEGMIRFREEVDSLTRPTGNPDFLGTDQINKNLTDIAAKLRSISKEQAQADHSLARSFLGGTFTAGGAFDARDKVRSEAANELRKKAAELTADLTNKTENLNQVESERLHISEALADIDKAEIHHKEQLGALAAAAVATGAGGSEEAERSLAAENERYALAVEAINKKVELENRSIQHASDLAEIQGTVVPKEERLLRTLASEVEYRRQILQLAEKSGSFEDRARAGAALNASQAALVSTARELAFQNSEQLRAAQDTTDAMEKQAHGEKLAAEQAKIRAAYEAKIRDYLREGKTALADQTARQENLAQGDAAYNEYQKYKANPGAYMQQRQQEKFDRQSYEYLRNQYWNSPGMVHTDTMDELYGGRPSSRGGGMGDPYDLSKGGDPYDLSNKRSADDKSGLNGLADLDFSGVQSLSGMDFSGLQPLNGLTITIA